MTLADTTEQQNTLKQMNLKAILFDMDGVLFDSMPHHAKAWVYAMNQCGVDFSEYEAYMREGMTGKGTISEIFNLKLGHDATDEDCKKIYKIKSEYFETLGEAKPMHGVLNILQQVKDAELEIYVVTGSAHKTLINTLQNVFPGYFCADKMVTAFDVKKGKPDPEPYLMALQKGHFTKNEVIVIENAPLGVKAGHAAGLFTIAVNTGILKDEELTSRGADLLYHNMEDLGKDLPDIFTLSKKNQ